MATKKDKNILQEAITDAKALKNAAYANAQQVLMEHLKDNVKQLVDSKLNESLEETDDVSEADEGLPEGDGASMELEADFEDELDVEEPEEGEEDLEEPEEEEDMEEGMYEEVEGLTEEDLEEALNSALQEVTHGQLGDMELVINTEPGKKSPQGIEDLDTKEDGWENKAAPKAKGAQLYTGEQYHQEALKWRTKAAQTIKENILLKKAMKKLSSALKETKLFNAKLFYASKLMQMEGLDNATKVQIVKKMDTVKTMSQAKNLYESLELALKVISENANTKKKTKKQRSLSEALGSGNTSAGSGAGISDTVLKEHNEFVRRNKKLAGLLND